VGFRSLDEKLFAALELLKGLLNFPALDRRAQPAPARLDHCEQLARKQVLLRSDYGVDGERQGE
jgi:hypothetical protein